MTAGDSPQQFFSVSLPALFEPLVRAGKLGGRSYASAGVVVRILGAGEWTLRLDERGISAVEGGDDSPALQVCLRGEDFARFVASPLLRGGAESISPARADAAAARLARWDDETAELLRAVRGSVLLRLRDGEQVRPVAFTPGQQPCSLTEAACIVDCDLEEMLQLRSGEANPLDLLGQGKLKLSGDAQIALAMGGLFL